MELNSQIILPIYELIDLIKNSDEAKEYRNCRKLMEGEPNVSKLKQELEKEKMKFEEVQRFGQFHPNYQEQMINMENTLTKINENKHIQQFRNAESKLNEMLYQISNTLAKSISENIIVVKDDVSESLKGCAIGGACHSCGVKGNCSI